MIWLLKKTGGGSPNVGPVFSEVWNHNLLRTTGFVFAALLVQVAVYAALLL